MDMEMKTMLPDERKYTYRQSQQISMQTSFIGYLRADFGSSGKEFYSSWNDFRKDLKTDEFKAEFDNVINSLRENDGILSGRGVMSKHCYDTPESAFENDREEYGVRVDTICTAIAMRSNGSTGISVRQKKVFALLIRTIKSCFVFLTEIKSALLWITANSLTVSADILTSTIWRSAITFIISASLPSEWSKPGIPLSRFVLLCRSNAMSMCRRKMKSAL